MSPSNFAFYDFIVSELAYQNGPDEAPITLVYEPHGMLLRRMNRRDAMHQAPASVPASGQIAVIHRLAQILGRLADSTQFFFSTAGGAETP